MDETLLRRRITQGFKKYCLTCSKDITGKNSVVCSAKCFSALMQ